MFLPIYHEHRDWFYEGVDIASIYGAPGDCLWGGGRVGFGDNNAKEVLSLLKKYGISARLTFSNSLLEEKHLTDKKCNALCRIFNKADGLKNGVIVHSDLLLEYLQKNYPDLYFVSSTTKVITQFDLFRAELQRKEFCYVVPDFRLNKQLNLLSTLADWEKQKVEFLVNECCWVGCKERKNCYENVSLKSLGINYEDHICNAPGGNEGYRFSAAMENPMFISLEDIQQVYVPMGFSNFKIEGRSLGSAIILEMFLYYMVRPESQLKVREEIYLDSNLDLF